MFERSVEAGREHPGDVGRLTDGLGRHPRLGARQQALALGVGEQATELAAGGGGVELHVLGLEAGDRGAQLVVWPESAFPFLFDRAQTQIYPTGHPWDVRGRYRGKLLFGALSHPFGAAHVFNSAVLVGDDGAVRGTYDKVRLVVFGEYIPMRDRFPAWAARLRARSVTFTMRGVPGAACSASRWWSAPLPRWRPAARSSAHRLPRATRPAARRC